MQVMSEIVWSLKTLSVWSLIPGSGVWFSFLHEVDDFRTENIIIRQLEQTEKEGQREDGLLSRLSPTTVKD